MADKEPPVRFTRQQIEFLKREFPEQHSPTMTADTRLWNSAQRHVIACMEAWVAKPGEAY